MVALGEPWGGLGVERGQHKVPSASSSGSLHFIVCVCSVVGWLIVYQFGINLYPVDNTVRPSVDTGEMITPA